MPVSLIPAFIYYDFICGITPGPANLTSLSTALRMGKKSAIRQWYGIFTGFYVISILSGIVSYLVGTQLMDYVKYFSFIGAAYIIWLAIHILMDKGDSTENESSGEVSQKKKAPSVKEGTFLFGFLLQMTNVKVMVSCITTIAAFVLPYTTDLIYILIISVILPIAGGPICNLVWLFAGVKLQNLFANHRRVVNIVMAASLIICAVTMVI